MKKGLIVLVMALVAAVAFAAPISFTIGAALDYNKSADDFFEGDQLKPFDEIDFTINDFTFGVEAKAHVLFATLDAKVDASPVAEAEPEAALWEKFDYRASVGAGFNFDVLMLKVSAVAGVTADTKWDETGLLVNDILYDGMNATTVLLSSKVFGKVAVDAKLSGITVGVQATVTPNVELADLLSSGDVYEAAAKLSDGVKGSILPYTSVGAYVGFSY